MPTIYDLDDIFDLYGLDRDLFEVCTLSSGTFDFPLGSKPANRRISPRTQSVYSIRISYIDLERLGKAHHSYHK